MSPESKELTFWQVFSRVLKISIIPFCFAIGYAVWDFLESSGKVTYSTIAKNIVGAFFLIMWFVGLFLRTKKQMKDDEHGRMLSDIHDTLLRDKVAEATTKSRAVRKSSDEPVLVGSFLLLQRELRNAVAHGKYDIDKLTEEYSTLAESIATYRLPELAKSNQIDVSHLSIESVCALHAMLFPSGYELAGSLRTQDVWITAMGSTTMKLEKDDYKPPPAPEIGKSLRKLLADWTRRYPELVGTSEEAKLEVIARFHHNFSSIHPFLDGNGRLIRLLLAYQVRVLLGKEIDIEALGRSKGYHESFALAHTGDIGPLKEEIKKFLK